MKNAMKIGKNFWRYKLILLFLLSLNYIFGFFIFLYSVYGNKSIVYALMAAAQGSIIAIGLYTFLKAKIYRKEISLYFYMIVLFLFIYGLIGFLKGAKLLMLAREASYFLNPLAFISIGYYLATKYNIQFILKNFFVSSFILALFGIVETLILPKNFFAKYYNTAIFYAEVIPIQSIYIPDELFYAGNLPKFRFVPFITHRLISFFGEPTTAGVYFGFTLLVIIGSILYYRKFNKVNLFFLFVITLIATILTQSRVALVTFFVGLVPLLNVYKKLSLNKIFLILFIFIIFISFSTIEVFQLYLNHLLSSLTEEGGIEHKEPVKYFFSNLTNIDYFLGKGLVSEIVADAGWGLIYYRMGYLGLFIYLMFFLKIFMIMIKNHSEFLRKLGISILCFTFVINFFNIYSGSFKSYNVIWALIGYSYYFSIKRWK